jgi:hypothetical protein
MRKTDWIKVILVVSLIGNVALFKNQERDNRKQELKYELLNAAIYRDVGQLEAIIQYQLDNNWENEALVTQKLDDAIDSIILNHGMEKDNNKEDVLWKLYDYLNEFKYGDGILDVSLNDKQRANKHQGKTCRQQWIGRSFPLSGRIVAQDDGIFVSIKQKGGEERA